MTTIAKSYPGQWGAKTPTPAQDDHCDPAPNARALFAVLAVYLVLVFGAGALIAF